jgi:hypothetical protein
VLAARAKALHVRGLVIPVAALEDVIRSKEAANRPKDHRNLPVLRQLLDELRRPERASARKNPQAQNLPFGLNRVSAMAG